jgi:GTPase
VANYYAIRKELTLYSLPLAAKPEIVCVSKAELTGAGEVRLQLAAELGRPVKLISSVTGQGLSELVLEIVRVLSEVKRTEALAAKPETEFSRESHIRSGELP